MTNIVRNRKATRVPILRLLPVLLAGLPVSGCIDPVEPIEVVLWEGMLTPDPSAPLLVEGSVAMVANAASTQVGIGVLVSEGEAEVMTWTLFRGRCGVTEEPVVAEDLFPSLVPNADGRADAEYLINRRVDPSAAYGVRVTLDSSNGPGSGAPDGLACGELVRRGR